MKGEPQIIKNNRKNTNFWRNVLIVTLASLFVWMFFSSLRMFMTYRKAGKNLTFAENQKIEIEKDIIDLNKKIEQIKTGKGVEEHIRAKYPVVKEGERVLVITNEGELEKDIKRSLWQKIKDIF